MVLVCVWEDHGVVSRVPGLHRSHVSAALKAEYFGLKNIKPDDCLPLVLGVSLRSLNRRCRSIRLALAEGVQSVQIVHPISVTVARVAKVRMFTGSAQNTTHA